MVKQNSRQTGRGSGSVRSSMIVILIFCAGFLTAKLLDAPKVLSWAQLRLQPQTTKPVKVAEETLPKPKFEFYTLLTQNKKPQPAPSVVESRPIKAEPTQVARIQAQPKANRPNAAYVVQLASFIKKEDAQRMKGDLILKGFDVSVVEVSHSNRQWYRVISSSFATREKAEKLQVDIARSEHVKGMILQTQKSVA